MSLDNLRSLLQVYRDGPSGPQIMWKLWHVTSLKNLRSLLQCDPALTGRGILICGLSSKPMKL